MEKDYKPHPLHDEQEVAEITLDVAKEFVLLVYENLAKTWWWEGLAISANINHDPTNPFRYILYQTKMTSKSSLPGQTLPPYKLGYLEIRSIKDQPKPVVVRLVCGWRPVLSFWQELGTILKRELPVSKAEPPDKLLESQMTQPTLVDSTIPWESIEDHGVDKIILKFWHQRLSPKEIAKQISRDPKTIRNTLSRLRKKYGEDVVPTAEQLKKRL
jgi:hypothetical protein